MGGLVLPAGGGFHSRQVANSLQDQVCLWCHVSVHSLAKGIVRRAVAKADWPIILQCFY